MMKAATAIAIAAIVAFGAAVSFGPGSIANANVSPSSFKGDRLLVGQFCSQAAWPYYDGRCLRGQSQAREQALPVRRVRVIAIDRLASVSGPIDECDCHQ